MDQQVFDSMTGPTKFLKNSRFKSIKENTIKLVEAEHLQPTKNSKASPFHAIPSQLTFQNFEVDADYQ